MGEVFPELTPEAEANRLGVSAALRKVVRESGVEKEMDGEFVKWRSKVDALEAYTLVVRARAEGLSVVEKLSIAQANPERWKEQYGNYKHAYLFSICRGKGGIRKYYAGWNVFCRLAASNIRYLLELVEQALDRHLEEGGGVLGPVDAAIQTRTAQYIGKTRLRELEGLALSGAKLTRLLLGLGRIFQIMAEDCVGHTPEVNRFGVTTKGESLHSGSQVDTLLRDGVMHLALLRYQGSRVRRTASREPEYGVHPIFAPFSGFSHRRKRRIGLSESEIWGLVEKPGIAIERIVSGLNRRADEDPPEQMGLFGGFYGTRD